MSTSDLAAVLGAPPAIPHSPLNSIVLATDGTEDGDDAVICAGLLEEIMGATVDVVTVTEPTLPSPPELAPLMGGGLLSASGIGDFDAAASAQRSRVRDQLVRLHHAKRDWPIATCVGRIGPEVAHFAQMNDADVIVVGRGRHGVIDRLLGEEHLTALLRETTVPVLVVDHGLALPAKRIVLAIDFSERNLAAVRRSLPYIDAYATVYLVHVKPDPPFNIPHPGQWIRSYEDGVRVGLAEIIDQLSLAPTQTAEPVILNGRPGTALSEFARAAGSDLIVAGSHGTGFLNRLVIGSVTTHLLRSAMSSLLLVP